MTSSFRLGRIFGIPLRLHYTWFIIFALVIFSLSAYYPLRYPLWERIAGATFTSILFFASVVVHELTHSIVARHQGIPVKNITLFIFGGVAQITREASRPGAELVMAAAGPLSSMALAGVFSFFSLLAKGTDQAMLVIIFTWLARINLILALFNLIPGFPLDGGRVLRAVLWKLLGNYRQATRLATWVGQGIAYLFIIGGIILMFRFDMLGGLWLAFIGWFLENAASSSYRQAELRSALQSFTAQDVMSADCPVISPTIPLQELVYQHILPSGRRCFLVVDEESLKGIITFQDVKNIPQFRWGHTLVSEAMTPWGKVVMVNPEEDAASILERMDEHNVNQLPVVKEGRIIGLIARDNLFHFIRLRSELGL
jgi:Zn-dependent protease